MRQDLGGDIRAFLYALGLHVLCVLLAFSGMFWWQSAKPEAAAGDPIEAVFVDLGSLQPVTTPPRPQPERPPQPRPEPPPPPAPPATDLSAQDLIEQQRIDRQALLRAEEDAREQEERRRRAEQILLEEEQERREEEQRQQRERQEREAREQAEREQAEQERIEREQAEQAAREQAELDAAEAAAQAEREAADRQAGAGGTDESLGARYSAAIRARVTSHWLRPDHVRAGIRCTIRITQIPGGEVISATVVEPCNADELTRRTIEAAVLRAQPLPYDGFESVFARSVRFTFRYDGNQ